jgi:hypothetical protein
MAEREALTAEYVRQILYYNPETGVFTWRTRPREHFATLNAFATWNAKYAHRATGGSTNKDGYLRIGINGNSYYAHRLAWLYMTGEWPTDEIDHVNGTTIDNKISNLRQASHAQNMINRKLQKNNTSGHKGVRWSKRDRMWSVSIKTGGRTNYLGYFRDDQFDEAVAVYEKAARELHGEFYRA